MASSAKRILFLVPYPLGIAPSQRFRFEQYLEVLERKGWVVDVRPFLDEKAMRVLYQPGNFFLKFWKVLGGLGSRFSMLCSLAEYDFVFVHREAAPIGPPIFEWTITKVFEKRMIFDFDDAIWLQNTSSTNSIISRFKRYRNASNSCEWAWKVSCGNEFLASHARKFNDNVEIIPTTIDTENHHSRLKRFSDKKITIGWTGSHSTMKYLDIIIPVLIRLETEFEFEFLVIADKKPEFNLTSLNFIPWQKESEIDDLLKIDVGVMPLENDNWANGKCGLKALQYLALGIPAIVSPVGVNNNIVVHGMNGWFCSTTEDWEYTLRSILNKSIDLSKYSKSSRKKVVEEYSVNSVTSDFVQLFE